MEEHLGIPDAEGELLLQGNLDQVELLLLDILDQVGLLLRGNLPVVLGILTFFLLLVLLQLNVTGGRWYFVNYYICVQLSLLLSVTERFQDLLTESLLFKLLYLLGYNT